MGIAYGNEALFGNGSEAYSGWYAPGVNIHRSPFGGRNPEYYSEDGLLTGWMAANTVKDATEMGCYTMVKNLDLYEQEHNRNSNGLSGLQSTQQTQHVCLYQDRQTFKHAQHRTVRIRTGTGRDGTSDVPDLRIRDGPVLWM